MGIVLPAIIIGLIIGYLMDQHDEDEFFIDY